MILDIRAWLALHVGCDPDGLQFAGADSRGVNGIILYFTNGPEPAYRVEVTERVAAGRRQWDVVAHWPTGSAATAVAEQPAW
jgi:hypothetical protein